MKYVLAGLMLGAASLGLSGNVHAQTLDETLRAAYESNPTLGQQRKRLEQTAENLVQARAVALPTLSADGSISDTEVWGGPSGGGTASYGVSLSQYIYAGGLIKAGISGARAQYSAGIESLRSAEQSVFLDAITAHANVVRDQQILSIRSNNVDLLAEQLRAARDRFEVGEITRTDVAQAEARLSASRAQLSAAQANLAASRAAYLRVTGIEPVQPETLEASQVRAESYADAVSIAIETNPDLRASQFGEVVADANVSLARSNLRPTVTLSASANESQDSDFTGNTTGSASLTARVSVPLFTGGANRSRLRSALAASDETRLGTVVVQRQIVEGVSNAWNNYLAAQAVIESSREAVRANEIAFEGVEQEAFVGLRTTLDVLNAEQELLNSRLDLASAERDLVVASYSLRQIMGLLHASELGFSNQELLADSPSDFGFARNIDLTPWN